LTAATARTRRDTALGRARLPTAPAGAASTLAPAATVRTLTLHGPPSRTIRVQRTPGATWATLRRSSRLRGPSGSSAAPTVGVADSNPDTAAATARRLAYPTAFFTAAWSSSALKAPSRRAATRPFASNVKVHGSVGRRKAASCGR
jgi:hypothetical protein